ncbi:hypothetical protein DFH09DRAFT_1089508 [Mycena vulgaris]|nr:hypothetical protein DFH09DRAFT_1089508 [Mycena vulgaris]
MATSGVKGSSSNNTAQTRGQQIWAWQIEDEFNIENEGSSGIAEYCVATLVSSGLALSRVIVRSFSKFKGPSLMTSVFSELSAEPRRVRLLTLQRIDDANASWRASLSPTTTLSTLALCPGPLELPGGPADLDGPLATLQSSAGFNRHESDEQLYSVFTALRSFLPLCPDGLLPRPYCVECPASPEGGQGPLKHAVRRAAEVWFLCSESKRRHFQYPTAVLSEMPAPFYPTENHRVSVGELESLRSLNQLSIRSEQVKFCTGDDIVDAIDDGSTWFQSERVRELQDPQRAYIPTLQATKSGAKRTFDFSAG